MFMKINPLPSSTSPCPSCVGSVPFDLLQESEDLTPAEIGVLRDNLTLEPWMVYRMGSSPFCSNEAYLRPQADSINCQYWSDRTEIMACILCVYV